MNKILSSLDQVLKFALMLLMFSLVASVSWQVISRYLFSSPSPWTEEVARYLLIWIGTLGAAYAFRTNMHIGLDLLPKKLTGIAARNLHWFSIAIVITFATCVLIIGGSSLVHLTWELKQYSAVLGLPVAYVYSVVPITGFLITVYSLAALNSPPDNAEKEEDI